MAALVSVPPALAGDILRGGASSASGRKASQVRASAGTDAAEASKATAQDRLARTTQAITAVRNMQKSAAPALTVPDGLTPGGLQKATGLNARWDGANNPVQNGLNVTIKQTSSQAVLHWDTFNVGHNTSVYFDQSSGKTDAGKWIAFNKVFDPSGVPSKILGSIKAEGQVYILNQNGIIFGAGSQVNTRTLVASALPINDNLVTNGLLNNRDAQFLFSALTVPGGADGTPEFTPPTPPSGGKYGDVVVNPGAVIQSPINADGNGGRVMLVGANVRNQGLISTPAGQTILAAGLQVGVRAHDQDDPSLRGLDVWIGDVGNYAGSATNEGLIESMLGSVMMAGREVNQLGAIDSTTSVALNGRVDLLASYGAVANQNFDNDGAGAGGPPFLSQFTGLVRLGAGSVTRILPDYLSPKTIPGMKLPESSRINIEGQTIRFESNALVMAPSGEVTIRAGTWPYKDQDNNHTTFTAAGAVEANLPSMLDGSAQKFLLSGGQVSFGAGSLVDVSGSTDVWVPLAQYLVEVTLRGAEFADSPLQRDALLRGLPLLVDLRRSGSYAGRYWVGTPLGDLTGVADVIQRNVAQLTARGGSITIAAGDSISVEAGATLDVSGGYYRNEGGRIVTSRLQRGPNLIDIDAATPNVLYDGVYSGMHTETSTKWGISKTFANPLAPLGSFNQAEYVEGASGGEISLAAPKLALAGSLIGRTVKGPKQLDSPPAQGTLELAFRGEKAVPLDASITNFVQYSPTPADIVFAKGGWQERQQFIVGLDVFAEEGGGFGNLIIDNRDGNVTVPKGTPVVIPAGGSLAVQAANVSVQDNIVATGGTVELTAYNYSPFQHAELVAQGVFANQPAPAPVPGRGIIEVGPGVAINVAGMIVDDRPTGEAVKAGARVIKGGSVTLEGYDIFLGEGSLVDASGGVWAQPGGGFEYGDGGKIALLSGRDPELATTIGGQLEMKGRLQAYSVTQGGALTIQTNLIQIGGGAAAENVLAVGPEFFRQGGFSSYSLIGIGERAADGTYIPAVRVAAGTTIEPVTESWVLSPYGGGDGKLGLRPFVKPVGLRAPAGVSLSARGADDPFTLTEIEALGLVVLEEGSRILTDPGASVSLKGDAVAVLGEISAPGGTITVEGGDSFPLALKDQVASALPTVFIGARARLSAAGAIVTLPDPFGRRSGLAYAGGTISISGNIVAEAGSVLDVSGASGMLDFHPTRLASFLLSQVPANSGLNTTPWGRLGMSARVDTNGGLIELHGSEMLYSDATLLGAAGGPTALGGSLSVSSGRFYPTGVIQTGADINMIVQQAGSAAQFGNTARYGNYLDLITGRTQFAPAFNGNGGNGGIGYFAVDQFAQGGFDALDLGYKFPDGSGSLARGGNLEFRGPVTINARGSVRLAGGGVIQADSPVVVNAPYVAVGQAFLPPQNPNDVYIPFRTTDPLSPNGYFFPPTTGPGSLSLNASLIDVGTLSMQGIYAAHFTAVGGDIRGNGTVDIAGDLVLTAAQVYPTTLATFNLFAYDRNVGVVSSFVNSPLVTLRSALLPPGFGVGSTLLGATVLGINGTQVLLSANANAQLSNGVAVYAPDSGSVTIVGSGVAEPPLSVGGQLNIYAAQISQGGTLRAPLGSITIGWDGTDLDPSDSDIDTPLDPIVRTRLGMPVAKNVTLQAGSVTSVSGLNLQGKDIIFPFGLSADGESWIDPRGVNVTISGLPEKRVVIAGQSVTTEGGSVIDIRGGGELMAFRWKEGNGGTVDMLGTPTVTWNGGDYNPGDLVTYRGQTWSARVTIVGSDFAVQPAPSENSRYWTRVSDSYAVVPGFDARFSPYNPFNVLTGDPGYVSDLGVGDQVYLEGTPGLAAGSYTLLPRRYALLPGAFLITPQDGDGLSTDISWRSSITVPEGSTLVSGYRYNSFRRPAELDARVSRFEVASAAVLAARAEYDTYYGSSFFADAAERLDVDVVQQLPGDAGYLALQGSNALALAGKVLASPSSGYRGASADISSMADIYLVDGAGSAPPGSQVVLNTGLLSSWGVESLLIGGLRHETENGVSVDVRTNRIVLDNAGGTFEGPEITLVSKSVLTLADGASIASSGNLTRPAEKLLIAGDGTLLRVSGDPGAAVLRSNLTGATSPFMTIGAEALISGAGVILDSTYATLLDPTAHIQAGSLTLGSGQISIVFDDASGVLSGSLLDPHLVLKGDILRDVQLVDRLVLQSYRSIDIYGTGAFGSASLKQLEFLTSTVRGYEQAGGSVAFQVDDVLFANPINQAAFPAPPGPLSGELRFDSQVVRIGQNAIGVSGYQNVVFNAAGGFYAQGQGTFTTPGNLTVRAPLVAAEQESSHTINVGGNLVFESVAGPATITPGLGAELTINAASIQAGVDMLLPSGQLTLHATTGDITVGGELSVAGSAVQFQDLMRFADAGSITLSAGAGDVTLLDGSIVSVAAAAAGGNAGTLTVTTPVGALVSAGELRGSAAKGYQGGSFHLDALELPNYGELNDPLEAGGFSAERNIRVRSGNVTIDGVTHVHDFTLSLDSGNLTVVGTIDASGETGGKITLSSWGSVTLASGAILNAAGKKFSNAGKGGDIDIEAGAQRNGVVNYAALLDIQAGSLIDLSVAESADFVAGDYTTPGSAAFYGFFSGKLHLRAPQNVAGTDLLIDSIDGQIVGASSIVAEGYRLYDLTNTGGQLTNTGVINANGGLMAANANVYGSIQQNATNFLGANGVTTANYTAMMSRLLANNAGLQDVFVLAPGAEIINRNGDLTLGTPTSTTTADWDFSTMRFGAKGAAGVLTLRASGNLVFNNALSDGFTPVTASTTNGNSRLWLAPLMTIDSRRPVNTQAWSYRLTSGADMSSANFGAVLGLDQLAANKGSLFVGEFYKEVPDTQTTGADAAVGDNGLTENTIQGNATSSTTGTRFEVIRTGAGDIDISAARDVQLRNQFATIYTAGVALPVPTTIFQGNDFVVPVLPTTTPNRHPSQNGGEGINLGAIQQVYAAQWSMAGGDVTILAGQNIGHYNSTDGGLTLTEDSSRQLPMNWLYRRGYVDPNTGLFGSDGGVDSTPPITSVTDTAASTTWWIDFSNFFEGVGALGGGDVTMIAGHDIVNVDAFAPTNARMAGRDPVSGQNLAPNEANLHELGGGDLLVKAGHNIDGGVYYVERGQGTLFAGGSITTNKARSTSISDLVPGSPEYGQETWLPTTLFVGKGNFNVSARGDVLLGPVANPFLLPQGLNNKFWYKTYFNTYSPTSGVNVSSLGGDVTLRSVGTLPDAAAPVSLLSLWLGQSLYTGVASSNNASYYQPWLRLAEADLTMFGSFFSLNAPNLRSTAFAGDINIAGDITLFPSPVGTLELAAAGSISGFQPTGVGLVNGQHLSVWTAATVNVSDADPALIPGVASPLAYQSLAGRDRAAAVKGGIDVLAGIRAMLNETGAYAGAAGAIEVKRALHETSLLHANDPEPLRLFTTNGDITGLRLFSPKQSEIIAGRDITDIAFYLQNVTAESISIVSAGRDVLPYNANAPVRSLAEDITQGNYSVSAPLAGDIQIGGSGVLEVLAARNVDLGTGATADDGTGAGITSIGNARNPFLPFAGARLIVLAGIEGEDGGPALGLAGSSLNIEELLDRYPLDENDLDLQNASFSPEHQAIAGLDAFFAALRRSAADAALPGGSYEEGFGAIATLFADTSGNGEIYTRSRNIRTSNGGSITIAAPGGGLTMAPDIFGNPQTPPGIVTEYGGAVSIFTQGSVDIGRTRIFTLRGGDLTIWSSGGDIAAGTAPKTVVTAPPTRVLIDSNSADVQTDLGGLATGGGIGVLASIEGVEPSNVYLVAPEGAVDAGDAGIRSTGEITIAAVQVLNADNIAAPGGVTGVPTAAAPAAPNISGLSSGAGAMGAASQAANQMASQARSQAEPTPDSPSVFTVEVLGYGGEEE